MRWTGVLLLGVCMAASAADDEAAIAEAKSAVERQLRDPGSAQYRDVFVRPGKQGVIVCGEVNAKNAYGGYVGFKPFMVAGTSVMLASDTDKGIEELRLELVNHVCRQSPEASP
ncbi:hypothetical protein L599_001200000640 [Luteimonas sp. J16]|uniref:hypothetical protein n=1 Tax=unclassified Luteimonas TaxID=2629088 RepID=UPI0011A8E76B|nr:MULTISPECIES: hypothetical protein [unclassified Luteimonas]TWG93604.1 hypothetical protein L599_001200000640 [Luteimonas sp. J16]